MTDSTCGLFASLGSDSEICPAVAKWPLACGPRSNMKLSKVEFATLHLNSRTFMRRGKVVLLISEPSNLPVGFCGNANQKPVESDPAATLPRYMLFGFVIQKLDAVLSEGSRTSLASWPAV